MLLILPFALIVFYSYILGRGWIDRSAKRLPTYSEITSSKSKKEKGKARADSPVDEDEEAEEPASENGLEEVADEDVFDEIADRFETSYNFRFEEPYVVALDYLCLC